VVSLWSVNLPGKPQQTRMDDTDHNRSEQGNNEPQLGFNFFINSPLPAVVVLLQPRCGSTVTTDMVRACVKNGQ